MFIKWTLYVVLAYLIVFFASNITIALIGIFLWFLLELYEDRQEIRDFWKEFGENTQQLFKNWKE